ncbi:two component transcriptional regulator, LuxR family [Muriicola jejuensis]|uniref:Response regulator n=1 Tax=Muriicola jejuensis TaxID=504488 RepID=A0A6P0UCL0_9FLAO|nr:response regulator transcription factor [Muriicola jejuensis]NER11021.1 response regulator [Muriicola jejuensis]SMP22881.1 two component transcriptional regulator, LuxR family [Muriicola jejuensis]
MTTKFFIVDDHFMVVEGIRSLLQDEKSVQWVGSARNAAFCMAELLTRNPDIILMDINLPDKSGIELCREVKQKYPSVKVIGLSTFNQQSFVKKMLESGASGYILKNAAKKELLKAMDTVMRGQVYMNEEVSRLLRQSTGPEVVLTKREKEILSLIAEGLTNAEIADRLYLGTTTVDTHRKHLLLKIGARNSAEMVKKAFLKNLLQLDS